MPTPSPANVVLGRGAILFDRFTAAGVRTGFRHLGNCDQLSVGIETEKLTMKDYTQQTSANYAEVLTSTNVNLTISGFEFDTENLALALLGNTGQFTQSAGSVVGEVVGAATITGIKGKFFRTTGKKITAVVVKQGATTLALGTDYQIFNAAQGYRYVGVHKAVCRCNGSRVGGNGLEVFRKRIPGTHVVPQESRTHGN